MAAVSPHISIYTYIVIYAPGVRVGTLIHVYSYNRSILLGHGAWCGLLLAMPTDGLVVSRQLHNDNTYGELDKRGWTRVLGVLATFVCQSTHCQDTPTLSEHLSGDRSCFNGGMFMLVFIHGYYGLTIYARWDSSFH